MLLLFLVCTTFYPFDALAWHSLGVSYSTLGRPNEALNAFDRCLEFKPDHYNALINRGFTFTQLKRYPQGLNSITRAIELDPSDPNG